MRKIASIVIGLLFIGGLAGLGWGGGSAWAPLPPIVPLPPGLFQYKNVTLGAQADAYTSEPRPSVNFGKDFYLRVGHGHSEFGGDWYSFVWFNLSEIPPDTNVTAAFMCLYLKEQNLGYRDVGATYEVRVGVPGDSWREDRITWNNMPSVAKEISSRKIGGGVGRYYCWDVTEQVKYWVSTPYINCPTPTCFRIPTNKGFIVYMDEDFSTSVEFDFESRENVHPPKLTIYYNSSEELNVTELNETAVDDTTPPDITVYEMAVISRDTHLCMISVTDDVSIKSVRIYDNEKLVHSVDDYDGSEYAVKLSVQGYGSHLLRVVALDYGGNIAEETLGIHIGNGEPPRVFIRFTPENPAIGELVTVHVNANSTPKKLVHIKVVLNRDPGNPAVLEDTGLSQRGFEKDYYIRAERGVKSYTATVYATDEEGLTTIENGTVLVGRCNDGILNQNEEGIDCGGVCEDCNPYEYGLISVGYYTSACSHPDIGDVYFIVRGFGRNLPGRWVKVFDYTWSTAGERMFRDRRSKVEVNGTWIKGEDDLYVDSVDLLFYSAHGGMLQVNRSGRVRWEYIGAFATRRDSCVMSSRETFFDEDLDWLVVYTCHSLDNTHGENQWLEAWNTSFYGLHMIMGFNGVTWIGWTTIEIGEDFADNLKDGDTFAQAWLDAATDWECCNKPAVMAVNAYVFEHDHLPGEGEVVYVPHERADPERMVWVGYTDCWGLDWC